MFGAHFVRWPKHKREKESERNGADWLHIVARESGISVRKLFISNWPTIPFALFFALLLTVVTAVCACGCRRCIRDCNLHV